MRIALLALLLAGCNAVPAENAEAPRRVFAGRLYPASANARALTGALEIRQAGLMFDDGLILYTRTLQPRRGGDVINSSGDSYAAAALGPSDLRIELRRVTDVRLPAGRVGLCGAQAPSYVALAYDENASNLTLLVFAGDEPPGPRVSRSSLCARYAYAPPDGARTREGVVL